MLTLPWWCSKMVSPVWTGQEGRSTPRPPVLPQRTDVCRHWRAPWLAGFAARLQPLPGTTADSRPSRTEPGPDYLSASGCWGGVGSSSPCPPAAGTGRNVSGHLWLWLCLGGQTGKGWWNCTSTKAGSSNLDRGRGWSWPGCSGPPHQRGELHRESTPGEMNKSEDDGRRDNTEEDWVWYLDVDISLKKHKVICLATNMIFGNVAANSSYSVQLQSVQNTVCIHLRSCVCTILLIIWSWSTLIVLEA